MLRGTETTILINKMSNFLRLYVVSSLCLLLATLIFGLLATWAFLYPETYNHFLPFYQLRPFHVSAALFWIITGAVSGIVYYNNSMTPTEKNRTIGVRLFIYVWLAAIIAIFICYSLKKFGGREYWEFPPILCLPLLISWLILVVSYFSSALAKNNERKPLYVWMWSTGIFFFLITFMEQNLWQIPWFRYSYLREITVQWKANGSMVGAWNQMLYGTSLYLMVKISGDVTIANNRTAFIFYMLGLTNLMFNWGHHIYNVPAASWIRDTSYLISMTEWIFFIRIIQGFKNKLAERNKFRYLITYKFIIAAEFWVFLNLLLALAMSVPAINRYTHGTHITVAHAMGTTIGINTMILLASFSYILDIDKQNYLIKKSLKISYWISQCSLLFFWLSLIAAGVIKAYRANVIDLTNFYEIMHPVMPVIKLFSFTGIGLAIGLGTIASVYIYVAFRPKRSLSQVQI